MRCSACRVASSKARAEGLRDGAAVQAGGVHGVGEGGRGVGGERDQVGGGQDVAGDVGVRGCCGDVVYEGAERCTAGVVGRIGDGG